MWLLSGFIKIEYLDLYFEWKAAVRRDAVTIMNF